jgi:large subunit ribosomal protein L15
MTVKRGKKCRKHRGSRTSGWGLCHRGAGQRGGRGNAGSGKKAKCKMPQKGVWTIQGFGKHGFKPKGLLNAQNPINLRQLEDKIDSFVNNKAAVLEKDVYVIDLMDAGYNKLLSAGKIKKKFKVTAPFVSKAAAEKVKAAGGEVIIPKETVTKEKPEENKQ